MAYNLWQTLLRPDQEEKQNLERSEVARAANVLQIGEFQLLQLAYREWHDKDLPEALVDRLFYAYMLHNEVPHWARHYARQINRLAESERINDNDPRFHRYDHSYAGKYKPNIRDFVLVVSVVLISFLGSLFMATSSAEKSLTNLPPYFSEKELSGQNQRLDGFGRADSIHPRPGP